MKAWQFANASAGGIENNMFLSATGVPKPRISDDQILVEVYSAALNPVDYKHAEAWPIAKTLLPSPKIPCSDFCGRVAETGSKIDSFRVGEMVFGSCDPMKSGCLGEFVAVSKNMLTSMPEGVDVDAAASIGIAGLTEYQILNGNVKKGDKVFINGGSGGCGVFGILIAKALGCHVTVSCSTANIDFCKDLGADEVLDYKSSDILKQLQEKGPVFKLVIDNVGTPENLYSASHTFLLPSGLFRQVGIAVALGAISRAICNTVLPSFLGGGKRKYEFIIYKMVAEDLAQLGAWLKEGKLRKVIDSTYEFDDAPEAYIRLKTGRARGKIVVHVKKN